MNVLKQNDPKNATQEYVEAQIQVITKVGKLVHNEKQELGRL